MREDELDRSVTANAMVMGQGTYVEQDVVEELSTSISPGPVHAPCASPIKVA